ncbi:hypothetical protein KY308_03350 [Candidatus Woesearchaeota archaeon]|nr:hypothetical protein [Candidatus Woesearchaeota archaeon]
MGDNMDLKGAIKFFDGIKNAKEFETKFASKKGQIVKTGQDSKIIDKLYEELLKVPLFKAYTWTQPKGTKKKETIMNFLKMMAEKDENLGKELNDFVRGEFKDDKGKVNNLYIYLATLLYFRRNDNPKASVLWNAKLDRPSLYLTYLYEEGAAKTTEPAKEPKGKGKSVEVGAGTVTVVGAVEAFSAGDKEKFQAIVDKADDEMLDKIFWNLYTEYIYPGDITVEKKKKQQTYGDFLIKQKGAYKQLITSGPISSKIEKGDEKIYNEKIKPYAINSTREWLKMDPMKENVKVTQELLINILTAKIAPKQKKPKAPKMDIAI